MPNNYVKINKFSVTAMGLKAGIEFEVRIGGNNREDKVGTLTVTKTGVTWCEAGQNKCSPKELTELTWHEFSKRMAPEKS